MRRLAVTSLLLVIVLVSLSAYLRLSHSGIGCADWPACYGLIGSAGDSAPTVESTLERLAAETGQALSWATPAHRLVASVLGLTVLALVLIAVAQKRRRTISIALLVLTVFLAWLGIYSVGLHSRAVVMGNLAGGFAMLALLGWMVLQPDKPVAGHLPVVRNWSIAALAVLVLQIGLGGLTSANFAASACPELPTCNGRILPGPGLLRAFDLSRSHEIGPSGLALGGPERAAIHQLHRLGAVLTTVLVVVAGTVALQAKLGVSAVLVLVLVAAEFAVGIAAVITDIPIEIAVLHNWLAAMLLLALLRLLALSQRQQAFR